MDGERLPRIHDFLGSVQVFQSVVDQIVDDEARAAIGPAPTTSQLKLLHLVETTDCSSVSDVASFLGISRAAASKAVDRLVRRGLLKRTTSAADRRITFLSLTQEGADLLAVCTNARNKTLSTIFEECSVEELDRVTRVLDQLSVAVARRETDPRELCFRCGVFFRDRCLLREHGGEGCYRDLPGNGRGRRRSSGRGRVPRG